MLCPLFGVDDSVLRRRAGPEKRRSCRQNLRHRLRHIEGRGRGQTVVKDVQIACMARLDGRNCRRRRPDARAVDHGNHPGVGHNAGVLQSLGNPQEVFDARIAEIVGAGRHGGGTEATKRRDQTPDMGVFVRPNQTQVRVDLICRHLTELGEKRRLCKIGRGVLAKALIVKGRLQVLHGQGVVQNFEVGWRSRLGRKRGGGDQASNHSDRKGGGSVLGGSICFEVPSLSFLNKVGQPDCEIMAVDKRTR